MRLRHPDGSTIHLAYCTNVHPAEDLSGVLDQLDRFAVPVREHLEVNVLGLGLWLAYPVAAALAADRDLRRRLKRELTVRGLETVTLNGFPYQAFQAPVVKHRVYHPDWTDRRRLGYTRDLARVLVDLLPDDAAHGSISTLPFAWRDPWTRDDQEAAHGLLAELALALGRIGRIRVALEPEPGCVVETTAQAIAALTGLDTSHLGICLDLAHLACAWEDPVEAVAALGAAEVPIVKVQVSAALEVADPKAAAEVLADYAEPRFLHQTRAQAGASFDDLPEALASDAPGPWRIHFHAPLHAAPLAPLSTTTDVLRKGLAALMFAAGGESLGRSAARPAGGESLGRSAARAVGRGSPPAGPACDHFEVETYTWGVLPEADRPVDDAGLVRGIAAELAFARDELQSLGVS